MQLTTALSQIAELGLAIVAPSVARSRTEQPHYTPERADPPFELRHYDPQVVAEVTGTGDREGTADDLFPVLADYIFATHRDGPDIEMTTPVEQAPVTLTRTGDALSAAAYTLRFTMPSRWTLDTLPDPDDDRVRLRAIGPRRMAVLPFNGRAETELLRDKEAELRRWIEAEALVPRGPAEFAYYDPPVTPGPWKLNEVRVEVE
ncbi:heme-binding protein [Jannaschia sp. W003]|uniref:SOUL family heme-binding protein n=1 Tax=Jannaschia sp. W003 TaxID=2867012 RepID=UPI0021A616F8|nr:heme-binding protein [Jannaschia sp. W003]UWQ20937.1 heme-binding protein [Jannaschia sp. W003]